MILSATIVPAGCTTLMLECLADMAAMFPEQLWGQDASASRALIRESIEQNDRFELIVRTDSGEIAGIAVAAVEHDPHVGLCFSVQWRVVFPQYRHSTCNIKLHRHLVHLARKFGCPVMAFTRRIGEGKYMLDYKRLEK